MSLDHYVTLGRSGLRVSPLCLGTMTFGEDWGWGSTVEESEAILARYLDRGGNFIDTANGYTKGHSEVIIGDYLARTPARRDRVVMATKFSTNLFPGDPNGGGAGRKAIVAACERVAAPAADRLHRSLLDALSGIRSRRSTRRCARSTIWCAPARSATSASRTRRRGKSRRRRSSRELRGWSPFVALQIEYSLIERTVEGELVPMALRARPRDHAVVAAARRRAVGQVHARQRAARQAGSRRSASRRS